MGERRKREEEKEENETERAKEDVTVLFLWSFFKSSVKGNIRRVVVVFLGRPCREA